MSTLSIVVLMASLVSIMLLSYYLDAKYNWRLVAWMNGGCINPFKPEPKQQVQSTLEEKDKQIQALTERVQVLEAIVTEPAYELNQKLNRL